LTSFNAYIVMSLQSVDKDLALKIHIKARASPKVVAAFAQSQEFDKILIYSKQVCTTQMIIVWFKALILLDGNLPAISNGLIIYFLW
jgi:hypothetical protein